MPLDDDDHRTMLITKADADMRRALLALHLECDSDVARHINAVVMARIKELEDDRLAMSGARPTSAARFPSIAVAIERERCACIVEGETYCEHYRQWPLIGEGNFSNDRHVVKHCDALAAVIRGRK